MANSYAANVAVDERVDRGKLVFFGSVGVVPGEFKAVCQQKFKVIGVVPGDPAERDFSRVKETLVSAKKRIVRSDAQSLYAPALVASATSCFDSSDRRVPQGL